MSALVEFIFIKMRLFLLCFDLEFLESTWAPTSFCLRRWYDVNKISTHRYSKKKLK